MLDPTTLKEMEANGTFDLQSLEKTLDEIRVTSFHFLKKAQEELVGHRRFDFTAEDLRVSNTLHKHYRKYPKNYVMPLDGNFISEKHRTAYKRSPLFNTELTAFTIASNPDIFAHNYLVFIDGKYYDSTNLFCAEGTTYIIFDVQTAQNPAGIPENYLKQLIQRKARITVFFIPNCAYGIYSTNRFVLEKYKDNLSLSRFNLANHLNTESDYVTFINTNEFLFSSVITDTVHSGDALRFSDNTLKQFNAKYVHLNVFGFRNLMDIITPTVQDGTSRLFTLPKKEMPIPISNLMIFRDVNGVKSFVHDAVVKMYYPFHYSIENVQPGEKLYVYVFYYKDSIDDHAHPYKNDLAFIQQFGNYNDPLVVAHGDARIRDYDPGEFHYDLPDYHSSAEYDDHLLYKINKLKAWIQQDPDLLRTYLRHQYNKGTGYLIDCSTVNLPSKYRLNNFNEVTYEREKVTFDAPHYVFVLSNRQGQPFRYYRFFINGELFVPKHTYYDGEYEYFYLPVSRINASTMIEVEKFDTYSYEIALTFSSVNGRIPITFTKSTTIDTNDIFLVNQNNKQMIPRSMYQISMVSNGVDVDLVPESFKKIPGKFEIRALSASILQIPMKLYIREHFDYQRADIDAQAIGPTFVFENVSHANIDFIRMFHNGRLLPKEYVDANFSNVMGGNNLISSSIAVKNGDELVADYTPYRYKTVYHLESIPSSGFLDLADQISRPFDLKWYDLYINGRKLHPKNVDVLSPTKVMLKNVYSLRNLYIIEKDRDEEVFGLPTGAQTATDKFWDLISGRVMEQYPDLLDTEEDILSEIIDTATRIFYDFFNTIIRPVGFINPDLMQVNDVERDRFSFAIGQNPYVINADDNPDGTSTIII